MSTERHEQEDALVHLVDIFDAIGLPYLLTGSLAASTHGMPRMTRDVDVLIDPDRDHRIPLKKALLEDFNTDPDVVDEAVRTRSMFNIIHPYTFSKIDVIVRDLLKDPDRVLERSVPVEILGRVVRTISPEDLVVANLRWAEQSRSVMQLRDVHWLLRLPDLDTEYLNSRILQYRLGEILEEARDPRYG